MVDLLALLDDAVSRFDRLLVLALVPLASTFLRTGNVSRVLGPHDKVLSVSFGFPLPLVDLWSFVDPPNLTGGVNVDLPTGVAVDPTGPALAVGLLWAFVALVLYVVLLGLLTAGYLGSIREGLDAGGFDFSANVRRFGPRLVGYQLVLLAAFLTLFLPALLAPPLVVLALPGVFAVGYILYPAPYLLILRDLPLWTALSEGVDLALGLGGVASYFLQFLVFSTVLSAVVLNGGPVGFLVGAVGAAPLALALNVATMLFFRGYARDRKVGAPTPGEASA